MAWIDRVAPPSWSAPSNDATERLLPGGGDDRHVVIKAMGE